MTQGNPTERSASELWLGKLPWVTVGVLSLGTKVGTTDELTIVVSYSESSPPIPRGPASAIPKSLESDRKYLRWFKLLPHFSVAPWNVT